MCLPSSSRKLNGDGLVNTFMYVCIVICNKPSHSRELKVSLDLYLRILQIISKPSIFIRRDAK